MAWCFSHKACPVVCSLRDTMSLQDGNLVRSGDVGFHKTLLCSNRRRRMIVKRAHAGVRWVDSKALDIPQPVV